MWWLFRDYTVGKAKQCHLEIGKLQHSSPQPGKQKSEVQHPHWRVCSEKHGQWPNWKKLWWFSHVNPSSIALLAFIWSVQNTAHLHVLHIWSLPLLGWLGSVLGAGMHRLCPTASLTACLPVCDAAGSLDTELKCRSLLSGGVGLLSLQLPNYLTHGVSLLPSELCCPFCVFTEVLSSLSLIILSPCGS